MNTLKKLSIYHYVSYIGLAVLLVCGLTYLLSSCSEEFGNRWERVYGKKAVAVYLSVGNAGYGANSEVTRSSTAAPNLQSAAVALGDSLFLQATLEPDPTPPATRAGTVPFEAGTRIRIVAYPLGSTIPADSAFISADGTATTRGRLNLPPDDYRFVAYAYNHPAYRSVSDTIEPLIRNQTPDIVIGNFPPDLDLLCGSKMETIGTDSIYMEIDMKHLYSRITKVEANTAQIGNLPFQTLSNVKIVSYKGDYHLALDSVSRADSVSHSIPNTWAVGVATSGVADTCLVFPGSGTVVSIGTVQVDNRIFHDVSTTFNTELQRGTSYTLHLNFRADAMPTVETPIHANTYVGAFWKSTEKGERVIRIPISSPADSAWTATVWLDPRWVSGSDGVLLAMGDSPDPTIRTGSATNNAESFPVTLGSTTINGVATGGYINFRIGLQNTYEAASNGNYDNMHPVRYAMVLIYYGPGKQKVQKIFLRQGEMADIISGAHDYVRWSPYNVGNYHNPAQYNNGAFVDFPTKAGYFYQWGYTTATDTVRPYPPQGSFSSPTWLNDNVNALYTLTPVCPTGYIVPAATGTPNHMASLFPAPQSDTKFVSGYYADGFFDRRPITNNAVSNTSNDIAHRGVVYYNPNTNASVFFPNAGFRDRTAGALAGIGGLYGYYWSSSPYTTNYQAYYLQDDGRFFAYRTDGQSVRCVTSTLFTAGRSVWLSPSATNTAKTIQVVSEAGGWALNGSQPTNATSSPTTGAVGTTNVTITRSNTVYGLSTFNLQNSATGEILTVSVDNYRIIEDDLLLPNDQLTGNTGTYYIDVWGGSENYSIVSYPSWLTSANVLPTGELELVAPQSPGQQERIDTIYLAHADDPTYIVPFPIIQDMYSNIPPFKYFVLRYTWNTSSGSDVDIVFDFRNLEDSINNVSPNIPFANDPYTPGSGSHKAVGWNNSARVALSGALSTIVVGTTLTGDPSAVANQQALETNLLFWGGDAQTAEGETVFFNAPQITPVSPRLDASGLPRYISMDAYAAWYSGTLGNPVRLTISTYEEGVMAKTGNVSSPNNNPTHPIMPVYWTNFYNVTDYTVNLLSPTNGPMNTPSFTDNRVLEVSQRGSTTAARQYRDPTSGYTHLARITYDRYTRGANIMWIAPVYSGGGIIVPLSGGIYVDGGPKP